MFRVQGFRGLGFEFWGRDVANTTIIYNYFQGWNHGPGVLFYPLQNRIGPTKPSPGPVVRTPTGTGHFTPRGSWVRPLNKW